MGVVPKYEEVMGTDKGIHAQLCYLVISTHIARGHVAVTLAHKQMKEQKETSCLIIYGIGHIEEIYKQCKKRNLGLVIFDPTKYLDNLTYQAKITQKVEEHLQLINS